MEKTENILELLQKNARLTTSQLSERLRIPEQEVTTLIKQCENEKIIHGYYALVNERKLGKQRVRALIEISLEPERDSGFDRLAQNLSKFPEVSDVMLVSGNFDLLLTLVGDSLNEVADFISRKLAPMKGVRSTRTHFMLKKYKEAGFQLEEDETYERLKITP